MRWLRRLLNYRSLRRAAVLDRQHQAPNGDRRHLIGQSPVDAWREWR